MTTRPTSTRLACSKGSLRNPLPAGGGRGWDALRVPQARAQAMPERAQSALIRSLCHSATPPLCHFLLLLFLLLPACASRHSTSPYAPQSDLRRDPSRADQLNIQAADLMATNPAKAEALLRDALSADLYHGPAHNNLGVLFLKRGDLYAAAAEFEWSRKLLPGHPDPRMNLALALESAGKTDDAIATYKTALEVFPNHLPTTQALARLHVRANKADDTTRAMLEEVALRGETQRWKDWARLALTQMRSPRSQTP